MIHHVSVGTNDVGRSKRFYDAVLPIVGLVPMAEDDGAPGLRPNYDANYHGAFVRDPDGHKIEAVTYSAK
ncbi:glyoxalase [Rhizobium changzhiense]|uniref:glyoxalase n=1 Tax=Rhizobium changzhiense TaxID=2692317 RepID=UPI001F0B9038|nr:glyoxalase [Rhizobium changzhiense]